MNTTPRIPWAWLALAAFVLAGSAVPEVAELLRWTLLLALVYLLTTHYQQVAGLVDRLLGGLAS